jgi:putative transcriptional regulator
MDKELEQFQADLLQSVREMKAGKVARVTQVEVSAVASTRARVGVSQADFAQLLGVSPRTVQDWEQGRRHPTGAAKTLLKIAEAHPEVLRELQVE